jgi:hypothetical protein
VKGNTMEATFNWGISTLDCAISDEGRHIVKTIHWRCDGFEIVNGKTCSGSVYGTCAVLPPAGDLTGFTNYADLKKEQVLGWVWAQCVDKDATESLVQAQINAGKTPAVVQPALPWDAE